MTSHYDPVAQLVEHLTFNQVVVSSNLTRIKKFTNDNTVLPHPKFSPKLNPI